MYIPVLSFFGAFPQQAFLSYRHTFVCHRSLCDGIGEFEVTRCSAYQWALISLSCLDLRHAAVSKKRQRGIALPGSGVYRVISATPIRNVKRINRYSPDLSSFCQGVSPRYILFTCMYRSRATGWLNQCMLFVRCVGLYIHMFFVCVPSCLHASCQVAFACVCVC